MSGNDYRGRLAATVATALAAATLAACSTAHSPAIAHAGTPAVTTASSSGSAGESAQAKFKVYLASERAYAQCMRGLGLAVTDPDSNGVMRADYKDTVKHGGHLTAAQSTGLYVCQARLLPDPRPQTYPLESDAEFTFEQKIAKCLRSHGVPAYPDPIRQTDPSLLAVQHYEAQIKQQPTATPTFQKALNTCSTIISGHTGVG